MSTSVTSSELVGARAASAAPAPARGIVERVGNTPLVRLQRSADGQVSVKREGQGAFGGFGDRVALALLADVAPGTRLWVEGLTTFSVACAGIAASRGLQLDVIYGPDDPLRLRELIQRFGVRLRRAATAEALDAERSALRSAGARALERGDAQANVVAWEALFAEVLRDAAQAPSVWVCAPVAGTEDRVREVFTRHFGKTAELLLLPEDGELQGPRAGRASCRRTQVGHREGILLSPLGAELVDAAVDVALTRHVEVCAVLPEEGHRYLGWW